MDPNAAGQSAGKKKIKEKEPLKIRYDLQGLKIGNDQKARCKLRMPANVPALYGPPRDDDPMVVLDVRDLSDTYCVMMMRDCLNKNILHAKILMERDPYLLVLVENYAGLLSTYLRTTDSYIPMFGEKSNHHMIPSPKLRLVVTQILDGLFALFQYGKYHGNLKLQNICYSETANGDIVPKLTSFKYKGTKNVSHYQAEDVRAVGNGLTEISEIAKDLNKQGYSLDCFQIEQLAQRLKSVSPGDLYYSMEQIKTYPFFWTEVETKFFFVSRVPEALNSDNVRTSIEGEKDLCTLPWNNRSYNGLLGRMIKYRQNKNKPAYNFNSRVSYVQFISGMYAHEVQLKVRRGDVDRTVKITNPRLCAILYSLLPSAPRPVDQH